AAPKIPSDSAETPEKAVEAPEKKAAEAPAAPVTLAQLRDAWPEILEVVQKAKRTAWMVVYTATPRILDGDVLTLSFPSETDVNNFKDRPTSGDSVSETLRSAINTVLGIRVKYVARVDAAANVSPTSTIPAPVSAALSAPSNGGWNVTPIPGSVPTPAEEAPPPADEPEPPYEPPAEEPQPPEEPLAAPATPRARAAKTSSAPEPTTPRRGQPQASARYGEAVVRELLGASFIEEQNLAPRDRPVPLDTAPAASSDQDRAE
ncbi:MAG: hypothetical protein M3N46_05750, partial [Actinomycetota bacterium]|nr:hypothetical protein [Actinomycetota bacterium]